MSENDLPPAPPPPGAGQPVLDPWGAPDAMDAPPTNLPMAIAATLLGICSLVGLILGIVAIVMASQSRTRALGGDLVGARERARAAMAFSLASIGVTALTFVVVVVADVVLP